MDDIIEVLYKCIIFKGLDKSQIRLALSRTSYHIKEYGKNEFICREDQFSENVGITAHHYAENLKSFVMTIFKNK